MVLQEKEIEKLLNRGQTSKIFYLLLSGDKFPNELCNLIYDNEDKKTTIKLNQSLKKLERVRLVCRESDGVAAFCNKNPIRKKYIAKLNSRVLNALLPFSIENDLAESIIKLLKTDLIRRKFSVNLFTETSLKLKKVRDVPNSVVLFRKILNLLGKDFYFFDRKILLAKHSDYPKIPFATYSDRKVISIYVGGFWDKKEDPLKIFPKSERDQVKKFQKEIKSFCSNPENQDFEKMYSKIEKYNVDFHFKVRALVSALPENIKEKFSRLVYKLWDIKEDCKMKQKMFDVSFRKAKIFKKEKPGIRKVREYYSNSYWIEKEELFLSCSFVNDENPDLFYILEGAV